MAETEDTPPGPPSQPRTVADILRDMRAARAAFQSGDLAEADYVERILRLDRSLTQGLSGSFNDRSGILIARPLEGAEGTEARASGHGSGLRLSDAEQQFIRRLETRSNAPPGFFDPENTLASKRLILNRFIENHPQLKSMTLADAVEVVEKTTRGEEVNWKYGDADPVVVASTALMMVDINRESLRTDHPALYRTLQSASPDLIQGIIGNKLMVSVQQDDEFAAWESGKRDQVVAAIRGDETLMADIGRLKPLLDATGDGEFVEQTRLRQSITQRMAGIYAQVYGVPQLGRGNVATFYAPAEKLAQNDTYGYSGGVPGIHNEEYIVMRASLYDELLQRYPRETARDVAGKFLRDVNEEMRHGVDQLYADRVVNEELPADHPAFRHANLIFLNNFNAATGDEAYPEQYTERTAKEAAAEIATPLVDELFPAQPAEQGQVIELKGMTIRADRP